MFKQFSANRQKIEAIFLNSDNRKYLSPIYLGQYRVTLPLIQAHVFGKFIDLGCGDMPYRRYIEPYVDEYDSLDFFPRSDRVKYSGDIQAMPQVVDAAYHSAMALEVLEHVPDPLSALKEIYRILKDEGVVIISVPHLSRLHDLPHDYFRFTRFGLISLLERAGFQVLSIHERGGLLTFLGHQVSLFVLSVFGGIPIVGRIAIWLNAILVTRLCFFLDRKIKLDQFFPAGYTVVARK